MGTVQVFRRCLDDDLCRQPAGAPMHAGYQRKRPQVADIDHHLSSGGKLGLFPFSLRLSALDLDSFPDDAATHAFMQARPPLVASPTQRPGGFHLYYSDTQPRHNGKWFDESTSCGGDVRSAHGYLVLWDPATLRILQARFQMGNQGMLFPSELLAEIPLKAPESIPSGLTESHRKEPSNTIVPIGCLLYTSPSPRDRQKSRMPSSA